MERRPSLASSTPMRGPWASWYAFRRKSPVCALLMRSKAAPARAASPTNQSRLRPLALSLGMRAVPSGCRTSTTKRRKEEQGAWKRSHQCTVGEARRG